MHLPACKGCQNHAYLLLLLHERLLRCPWRGLCLLLLPWELHLSVPWGEREITLSTGEGKYKTHREFPWKINSLFFFCYQKQCSMKNSTVFRQFISNNLFPFFMKSKALCVRIYFFQNLEQNKHSVKNSVYTKNLIHCNLFGHRCIMTVWTELSKCGQLLTPTFFYLSHVICALHLWKEE